MARGGDLPPGTFILPPGFLFPPGLFDDRSTPKFAPRETSPRFLEPFPLPPARRDPRDGGLRGLIFGESSVPKTGLELALSPFLNLPFLPERIQRPQTLRDLLLQLRQGGKPQFRL